jgi:hypothetical protein
MLHSSRARQRESARERESSRLSRMPRKRRRTESELQRAMRASMAETEQRECLTQGMSSLTRHEQMHELNGKLMLHGLEAFDVRDDGNCLFLAVAKVLNQDASPEEMEESAAQLRAEMVALMRRRAGLSPMPASICLMPGLVDGTPEAKEQFDTLEIVDEAQIARFAQDKEWGDERCLQYLPWCPSVRCNIRVFPVVGPNEGALCAYVTGTPKTLAIGYINNVHFTATRETTVASAAGAGMASASSPSVASAAGAGMASGSASSACASSMAAGAGSASSDVRSVSSVASEAGAGMASASSPSVAFAAGTEMASASASSACASSMATGAGSASSVAPSVAASSVDSVAGAEASSTAAGASSLASAFDTASASVPAEPGEKAQLQQRLTLAEGEIVRLKQQVGPLEQEVQRLADIVMRLERADDRPDRQVQAVRGSGQPEVGVVSGDRARYRRPDRYPHERLEFETWCEKVCAQGPDGEECTAKQLMHRYNAQLSEGLEHIDLPTCRQWSTIHFPRQRQIRPGAEAVGRRKKAPILYLVAWTDA